MSQAPLEEEIIVEVIADEDHFDRSARRPSPLAAYWRKVGGGSLSISISLHAALILLAAFWILYPALTQKTPPDVVEFLPGGGGGQEGSVASRRPVRQAAAPLAPAVRLAAAVSSPDAVLLPNTTSTVAFRSAVAVHSTMGGPAGAGHGGGAGGGTGTGLGQGFGSGIGPGTGPGFVAMFGKTIKARKLAVVLDVSGSMHRYLPAVVKEANKVSGGCPIVLFYGCGLKTTADRSVERRRAEPARGKDFKEYWQRNFAAPGNAPPPDGTVPNEEVFKVFNDRRDTWYFDRTSITFAWLALNSPKVRDADAIYWFCDFQDDVDEEKLLELQKLLRQRQQKLYVHASGGANPSLAAVTEMLVKPTGGEVLKVEIDTTKTK